MILRKARIRPQNLTRPILCWNFVQLLGARLFQVSTRLSKTISAAAGIPAQSHKELSSRRAPPCGDLAGGQNQASKFKTNPLLEFCSIARSYSKYQPAYQKQNLPPRASQLKATRNFPLDAHPPVVILREARIKPRNLTSWNFVQMLGAINLKFCALPSINPFIKKKISRRRRGHPNTKPPGTFLLTRTPLWYS